MDRNREAARASGETSTESRSSRNAEARELYQSGPSAMARPLGRRPSQATLLLEQAVAADPSFALAHSALADAYAFDGRSVEKGGK